MQLQLWYQCVEVMYIQRPDTLYVVCIANSQDKKRSTSNGVFPLRIGFLKSVVSTACETCLCGTTSGPLHSWIYWGITGLECQTTQQILRSEFIHLTVIKSCGCDSRGKWAARYNKFVNNTCKRIWQTSQHTHTHTQAHTHTNPGELTSTIPPCICILPHSTTEG